MSLIATTVSHPKEADSGQSVPGAFPSETEQGPESQKEQQVSMNRLENQGKTVAIGSTGASRSQESKQPAEDDSWLKSLDALEAKPNTGMEFREARHTRLSLRQLEIQDHVDIMDAMERGEW